MDSPTTNQLYIWFYFHIMQFWSVSFWILNHHNHPSQNWLKPGQILRFCIPYSGIALLSCRFSLPSIQTWAFSSWLNDFQGVFLKVFFSLFHMPGLNAVFLCGMILNHRSLRLGTGRTNIFRTLSAGVGFGTAILMKSTWDILGCVGSGNFSVWKIGDSPWFSHETLTL